MKIAYASDLHIEFYRGYPRELLRFPAESDVIVLAGDIDVGPRVVESVQRIADDHPAAVILWVAGNHEFYRTNIDDQIAAFREAFADDPRIHFLENDRVDIGGVSFLGCTLWTDFTVLGADEQRRAFDIARRSLTDFVLIESREGRRYTPEAAARRYKESHGFLAAQLAKCDPANTVVVTHFPPGMETSNTNFETDLLTTYFQTSATDLLCNSGPALWIYGHNHFSNDLQIGRTRLVSNQLGYPNEAGNPAFVRGRLIDLACKRGEP
jgi:predicted phosphohydrolase